MRSLTAPVLGAVCLLCFLIFAPGAFAEQNPAPAPEEQTEKTVEETAEETKTPPPELWPQDYIGRMAAHKAIYEDTLIHLAREHNLGFAEIRAANPGLDPWLPGAGTQIILPTLHILPDAPRHGIVINLAEMRLYRFPPDGKKPVSYPIGIGRDGLTTPTGQTKIIRKVESPTWRPTDRMRKEDPSLPETVPPGPANPLGSHALYFDWPSYLIHGTNRPFGIGRRVSSGCIRLYPEHIPKLYKSVPVGTSVTIIDQPLKAGWIGQGLYVEAHAPQEFADDLVRKGRAGPQNLTEAQKKYIQQLAGDLDGEINWEAAQTAVRESRGYPVKVAENPDRPENDVEETIPENGLNIGDFFRQPSRDLLMRD